MNNELQDNLTSLISKFENGKERYQQSAMFNRVINTLVRGADPLVVIDQLIKAYDGNLPKV
jgi:hypothetical protein